jgi:hypothetical protein
MNCGYGLNPMAKTDINLVIRPFRVWSVNGSNVIGAHMQFAGMKWIVINWDKQHRALTMVSQDATMSVTALNPLCMQWEK